MEKEWTHVLTKVSKWLGNAAYFIFNHEVQLALTVYLFQ